MEDLNRFLINKEIGKFCALADGTSPTISIWLDNVNEKAEKVANQGFPLSSFQTALFTFLHEYHHYQQFQNNEVTAAEINDPAFRESEKCKKLEKQADEAASNFIKMYRVSFDPSSLQILSNQLQLVPKVGDLVEITKDIELIETVYFEDGLHCGQNISSDAVELGQYKISIKKGSLARINSLSGSRVSLVDISNFGVISAYDSIKGKEIANDVLIHSCMVDLLSVSKVD